MPRPPSPCSSDGRESYWADGRGPNKASAQSIYAYQKDDEIPPPRHRGGVIVEGPEEEHYQYIPYRVAGDGTGGGCGQRGYHAAPPRGGWMYLGRDGREYSSYEEMVAADERWRMRRHNRSKKGGDWLLLAAAVTVAAAVYLFGTAEKKRAKKERRERRAEYDSESESKTELGSPRSRSRGRSRSMSRRRRASASGRNRSWDRRRRVDFED